MVGNNGVGLLIDGTGSSGLSTVQIDDSLFANNGASGITVNKAGVVISRSSAQDNAGNGILAGPSSVIHIGNSAITGNFLAGLAFNGGQILSYQNNMTKGNNVDNPPSGALTLN